MDTVTVFTKPPQESVTPTVSAIPSVTRTLAVSATYLLSEDGRKASLLTGGDGKAVQQLTLQIPANRLHLVGVDPNGIARLKLRPRFQLDGEQRVVRIDAAPVYDAPPDIEELFREAARNHQLERAYVTERQATKLKRREADQDRRAIVAKAFLTDSTQRALAHPPPTPKRCVVIATDGRIVFDANIDSAPARDVPPEAHRRFRADLRARRERNLEGRAAQLAHHEEKKRFAAEWIAAHGTSEQRTRQAAGVLPIEEVIETMADDAFARLNDRPRYAHDGVTRLQAHVQQAGANADAIVTREELTVKSANVEKMTAAQWALVQECQALVPQATVLLRTHQLTWKRDSRVPAVVQFGLLVTKKAGPSAYDANMPYPSIDCRITLSGEKRVLVDRIAQRLEQLLGPNSVFYDAFYPGELAQPDLDTLLQNIYGQRSTLVVVVAGSDYQRKNWCGLEFRAIKQRIWAKEHRKVMIVRTDDGVVDGIFETDG
jgi:hypothetical protein